VQTSHTPSESNEQRDLRVNQDRVAKKQAKLAQSVPMPKISRIERNFVVWVVGIVFAAILPWVFGIRAKRYKHLPKKTGYVLVGNHCTNLDGVGMAYFGFWWLKRMPHFLAKEAIFRVPVLGWILLHLGQVPIFRDGKNRNDEPLRAAIEYLRAGQVLIMYPEGTLTREPDMWPMRGKPGAVRMALEAGVPVYPFGQWGTQEVLGRYSNKFKPSPKKRMRIIVGDAVNLDQYRDHKPSLEELVSATEQVMKEITKLVEELRGEKAPETLFDPAAHGLKATGDFTKVQATDAATKAKKK
jgi:1-acyl-sn-glycerol-3-phosphate acyltransferase